MGINDRADDNRRAWTNNRPGEGIAAYHAEQRAEENLVTSRAEAVRDLCERFAQYARSNNISTNAKAGLTGGWVVGTFEGSSYSYGADQQHNWDLVVKRNGKIKNRLPDENLSQLNQDTIKAKIAWYVTNSGVAWPWSD